MDNWQYEDFRLVDKHKRRQLMEEIRNERLIRESRVYHPGAFARIMRTFANWLIAAGEWLRRRYEAPCMNCSRRMSDHPA